MVLNIKLMGEFIIFFPHTQLFPFPAVSEVLRLLIYAPVFSFPSQGFPPLFFFLLLLGL